MKRSSIIIFGLVVWMISLCGCAEQVRTQEPLSNAPVSVGDEAIEATNPSNDPWPFRPSELRIHPLTRVVMDEKTNDPIIEVRIEFIDPNGHTTKGVGQIRIDLLSKSADDPIAIWSRDLRDLEVNFEHYDEITQTYLFRLRINGKELPINPSINAYFLAVDGLRLEANYQLK